MASSPPHLRYRERVLICMFEDIGRETPDRVFSTIPKSSGDLRDGFVDLTFAKVVVAVDFLGRWLKQQFRPEGPAYDFETLTYFGIADIRYTLLTLAAIKCRYKTLLPSARNTVEVNASLMQQTQSTKVLHSVELEPLAKSLASAVPGSITIQIPSLDEILAGKADPIEYNPTFEAALHDPIVILHSSGSTGLPKPITYTNGTVATLGADWGFKPPDGRRIVGLPLFVSGGGECRYFSPVPPFHLGGLYFKTVVPIMSLGVPIYHPATRLPSSDLILEVMQHTEIQAVALPPSLIEGLLHVSGGLEQLKKLDWIMFSGGPLSQSAGDEISKYTILTPYYGSTELLAVRQVVPRQENWSYLNFHPDDKYRMEHQDDNIYELVALTDPDARPSYAGSAAFVHSLPGTTTFRTKDLFTKHAQFDLWQYYGRKDDIIVLSSGEKFNPVPMEMALGGHVAVAGALIVGQGRSRPALIVEPKASSHQTNDDLKAEVWVAVQKANINAPQHGRISLDMILISDPARPFTRTGKGSVVRKLTLAQYEAEIEGLFDNTASVSPASHDFNASKTSPSEFQEFVRSVVADVLPGTSFTESSNLYLLGMDSLTTADAVAAIARRVGRHPWLTPNIFYTNPSVEQMASAVLARLTNRQLAGSENYVLEVNKMITRKISDLHTSTRREKDAGNSVATSSGSSSSSVSNGVGGFTVVVTGTTGSLGSEIVSCLASHVEVKSIVCLNRSEKAQENWKTTQKFDDANRASVRFYTADFSQPSLGLQADAVQEVQSCDFLIHNAWKVDFNQNLASFEDNLDGLGHIIRLCDQAMKPPHLVFISSISSTAHLIEVPESGIEDASACAPMGYGGSKFVAERMLDHVMSTSPRLHGTVLRVGQIAGSSVKGGQTPWPEKEAFPGMFRTSKSLGLIPDGLPPVNWIPIDKVAEAIIDLSTEECRKSHGLAYHNVVNPHQVPWKELLGPIREYCGRDAEIVSLEQWIRKLKELDPTDKTQLSEKPALKTLDFFDYMASNREQRQHYETSRAVSQSKTLASLKPVSQSMLRQWLSLI